MQGTLGLVLAVAGILFLSWLFLVTLFTPAVSYHVRQPANVASAEFLHWLQSTCASPLYERSGMEILRNGDRFYPLMLEAIRGAKQSVCLECYIFEDGQYGRQFVTALTERARAGVVVMVTVDSLGGTGIHPAKLNELKDAGGHVRYYQPVKWHSLQRLNNRTHREILVVDGTVAFVGGAGIADRWAMQTSAPKWRDSMFRVRGPMVAGVQGTFAANWLESSGEILTGAEYFPELAPAGDASGFIVRSSASRRTTASRAVFQLLIESASQSLFINTPYFIPDRPLRTVLIRVARSGVSVAVLVPGARTDNRWVRIVSRRYYGQLLEAGVRIFEYQPSMIHSKVLVVDDLWSVVGTTNMDNRSFEHNDEVNAVIRDAAIAVRLKEQGQQDINESVEITLADWRARPYWERLLGTGDWLFERQQ
jgi:cardiolipin synthase A/B